MSNRKRKPRTRLPIAHRAKLASVLNQFVDAEFGGVMSSAAKSMGIPRPNLSRLANGRAATISFRDLSSIRRAVPREVFAEVDAAVVSLEAAELLRAFDAWCNAEMNRLLWRDTLPNTVVGRAIGALPGWEHQRMLEAETLLEELRERFPGAFKSFDEFAKKRRHFAPRIQLAFARTIAPLLEGVYSGHVERRWQEMEDAELREFLEAGLARERILLQRVPDVQRAHESSLADPVDLMDIYGQVVDDRAFFGRNTPHFLRRYYAKRVRATS